VIVSLKFPAKIYCTTTEGRERHQLIWSNAQGLPVLEFIKDFVLVKRTVVELGIEYISLTQGRFGQMVSRDVMTRRLEIIQELSRLNNLD